MVGPIRLLMHLWWCTHIDSWHVMFWFAYISDLEFWLAFVWSIILVLLCQHSFSDVWTCFNVCSLRLCISFSLHHRWAYPRVSCMVTFCVWRWILSCTGAYPHPWVHQIFYGFFSLLILFLDLCESSYWGIPPLALFYWGIPPSLSLAHFMLISWLSDPFVDLYELSPRASPYCHLA